MLDARSDKKVTTRLVLITVDAPLSEPPFIKPEEKDVKSFSQNDTQQNML